MKKDTGRRGFLKNVALGSVVALAPARLVNIAENAEKPNFHEGDSAKRTYNSSYTGEHLNRIAFPIGGIGAGMFCLEGTGSIAQVSTRNRPEMFNDPGVFAAIVVKGPANGAKLLE